MAGRPISIAEPAPLEAGDQASNRFRFNTNLHQQIGSPERLANSKVAVISVAGAFRKGKSFLLNFFLRFLTALSRGDTRDWIRSGDSLEDGFHWRCGSDRDTTGILIWSEPFFIRRPNGEEVAVLLMDTQGMFDHQSAQQDCTTIFAFSTLLSSVQIFNISKNIQETDLQYLRLFIEFAAMAKNSKEKVLQHLWFLVRDWQDPDEHAYGVDGGRRYLEKVLACDGQRPRENQELRRGIRQRFEKASCCLLPHPGRAVASRSFRGEIASLDQAFVLELEKFIPQIADSRNLTLKAVNGQELTGRELFGLMETYFASVCSKGLPDLGGIFNATVEMTNQSASNEAKRLFDGSVMHFLGENLHHEDEFNDITLVLKQQALNLFTSRCMQPDSSATRRVSQKLQEELEQQQQRLQFLWQMKSSKSSADERSEKLMIQIESLQIEQNDQLEQLQELRSDFDRRVADIRRSRISRPEMERQLRELQARQAAAQRETVARANQLHRRVEELADLNQQLMEQLSREKREAVQQQQRQMRQLEEQRQREVQEESESDDSNSSCLIM